MLIADGLIKSPTKEKGKKTKAKKCKSKDGVQIKSQCAKKKPKCAKEGYAKRGTVKVPARHDFWPYGYPKIKKIKKKLS